MRRVKSCSSIDFKLFLVSSKLYNALCFVRNALCFVHNALHYVYNALHYVYNALRYRVYSYVMSLMNCVFDDLFDCFL